MKLKLKLMEAEREMIKYKIERDSQDDKLKGLVDWAKFYRIKAEYNVS